MFLPEYTITAATLKNIGEIEYAKAIVENTSVLASWEKQLQKEARIKTINASMIILGLKSNEDVVKEHIDKVNISKSPELTNINEALTTSTVLSENYEMEEVDLKFVHKTLAKDILPKTKSGVYRNKKIDGKVVPEEILAYVVELFDWYNSLDAKETHVVIKAAILKAMLETIHPFESFNKLVANVLVRRCLKTANYDFKGYLSLEDYYYKTEKSYTQSLSMLEPKALDFTTWIEYFTEGYAMDAATVREKVKLLAKDTKVAKATGRVKLSPRQERIVLYLQDYGLLQNRNFSIIFPDISEDTVLRDLKALIKRGIVVKKGSTKSSRYELR